MARRRAGIGARLVRARLGLRRRPAAPAPERAAEGPRAVGYVCLERGDAEAELGAGKARIREWCAEHEVALATIVHDDERRAQEHSRRSLRWALEQIAAGRADLLIVARLRDLSPDDANLTPLLRWFTAPSRRLVALDLRLDTSGDASPVAAKALAEPAPRERAARSRASAPRRTAVADRPDLQARIAGMRRNGMTLQAIADALNGDGVPTLRGGALWRPSSVQRATGYRRPSSRGRSIERPRENPFDERSM